MRVVRRVAIAAVLGLLLGACSGGAGPTFPPTIEISSRQVIGQSFVAAWDGLHGIEVYLTRGRPQHDLVRLNAVAASFALELGQQQAAVRINSKMGMRALRAAEFDRLEGEPVITERIRRAALRASPGREVPQQVIACAAAHRRILHHVF
jgi:hypothetical protein